MSYYAISLANLIENQILSGNNEIMVAEIGVFRGDLSRYLLSRFQNLTMYLVDAWIEYRQFSEFKKSKLSRLTSAEHLENRNIARAETEPYRNRRIIIERISTEAAKYVPDGCLDLVFIDANHIFTAVRDDIVAWRPKLKPRGILSGHDYGHHRFPGVQEAVDEHVALNGLSLKLLRGEVWWTRPM